MSETYTWQSVPDLTLDSITTTEAQVGSATDFRTNLNNSINNLKVAIKGGTTSETTPRTIVALDSKINTINGVIETDMQSLPQFVVSSTQPSTMVGRDI